MEGMVCILSERLRWVPLLSLLAVTGCVSAAHPARVTEHTPLDVVVPSATEGASAAAPPLPPAPTPVVLAFEAALEELDRACPNQTPDDQTNLAMKETEAAQVACLESAANRANAAALATFAKGDARRQRIATAEATYQKLADDVCWASEEVQWVDLEEGTRDDGSIRDYAWLACRKRVQTERFYLLRTLGVNDARGFAQHLDEVAVRGSREAALLQDLDTKAKALAAKPAPTHLSPPPVETLGAEARRSYVVRRGAIDHGAHELGRQTCALFAGLATEAGGEATCERKAARGLLALGAFEYNGEDAGP